MISLFLSLALAQPFYIAHIPDTQHYSYDEGRMQHLYTMMARLGSMPIKPAYVAHAGDVTEFALPIEFTRTNRAFSYLGDIPFGASIGNHDYDAGRKCTGQSTPCTVNWRQYRGEENFVNVFQTPEGPIAMIHLEYMPADHAIEMAMDFMDRNPKVPAILDTHYYLDIDANRGRIGSRLDGAGDNSPEMLWEKLIVSYPQIFMVLAGHVSGESRRQDTTILGTEVGQYMVDFQSDPNGGNGFFRVYLFSPGRMDGYTVSFTYPGPPAPDRTDHFFVPSNLWLHRMRLQSQTVSRLYPVADTFVMPCWGGGSVRGWYEYLIIAGSGCQEHGLIKFDLSNIKNPTKAVLTLTLEGPALDGDGFSIHRMLRAWGEGDSWNSLGGLVAGRDYVAAPEHVQLDHGFGTINIDFTQAMRNMTGSTNYGWVAVGRGNSSGFRSKEWWAKPEQPRLTVIE